MDEREILKLELAARGADAMKYFAEMFEKCVQTGDKHGEDRWARKLKLAEIIKKEQLEQELKLVEFRPGRNRITKRLAAMIATFLTRDISARNRQFNEIVDLYEARGLTIHSARSPTPSDVKQAFDLARACFIKTIENSALPNPLDLLDAWRRKNTNKKCPTRGRA